MSLSIFDFRKSQLEQVDWSINTSKTLIASEMGLGKTGGTLFRLVDLIARGYARKILIVAPLGVARMTWPEQREEWTFCKNMTMASLRDMADVEPSEEAHRRARFWIKKLQALREQLVDIEEEERKATQETWRVTLTKGYTILDLELAHIALAHVLQRKRETKAAIRDGGSALRFGMRSVSATQDAHTINWQNLHCLVDFYGKYWPYSVVVYDESDIGLKNEKKSVVWDAMNAVRHLIEVLILQSGTPMPEGLMDLWGQIYLLDGGAALGKNITAYRKKYFDADEYGHTYTPKPGAMEQAMDAVKHLMLVQRSEHYMDLPPTIYYDVPVVLSDEAMGSYYELQEEYLLDLPDGEITADNAASLVQKLMQLANGRVLDKQKHVHEVHSAKLDALDEYLYHRRGENVLLAPWFVEDVAAIMKRFKRARYLGNNDNALKAEWNAGKVGLMLVHPGSNAHGLNVQFGGRRVLWFGPIFRNGLYQQLNKRLDGARAVGLGTTFIDHFIAKQTVDEHWIKRLRQKADTEKSAMDYVRYLRQQMGLAA